MKRFIILLITIHFTAGFIYGEGVIDSLFDEISTYDEFQCSLSILQLSRMDTSTVEGFIAWKDKKFFAHFDEDYFLGNNSPEILHWSEGSDAIPSESKIYIGDWINIQTQLENSYLLETKLKGNETIITGISKTDETNVPYFEIVFTGNKTPGVIKLRDAMGKKTEITFKKILKESPPDSLFNLPKGVEVIR